MVYPFRDGMKSVCAVYDEPTELPAKMMAMKRLAKQDVSTPSAPLRMAGRKVAASYRV
ncbi:MAG: hypothetical protein ACM3MK_02745 [Chitinophagales bacterium]